MDVTAAKKLISESGNNFQCKVANYFRENGWSVLLSPYYVDSSSDKTREIDLIVERAFHVKDLWGSPTRKVIVVRLFIECKFIAHGAVFWFDTMDTSNAMQWIVANTCFPQNSSLTYSHHYLLGSRPVAKLFASAQQKGEENDPIFRAVNQCLNGFLHSRNRDLLSKLPNQMVVTHLDYPVVVCSDFAKVFRTEVNSLPASADPIPLKDNFMLEVNYAYLNKLNATRPTLEYFLIDFVEFSGLGGLVTSLANEAEVASKLLGDN